MLSRPIHRRIEPSKLQDALWGGHPRWHQREGYAAKDVLAKSGTKTKEPQQTRRELQGNAQANSFVAIVANFAEGGTSGIISRVLAYEQRGFSRILTSVYDYAKRIRTREFRTIFPTSAPVPPMTSPSSGPIQSCITQPPSASVQMKSDNSVLVGA